MIRNEDIPEGGLDIPGPIDWEQTSHGLEYDYENFTVQTWGRMGPRINGQRAFRLMTRIRRMSECEVIGAKLRGHDRRAVLDAYGIDIDNPPVRYVTDPKVVKMGKRTKQLTYLNIMIIVIHVILYAAGVIRL